MSDIAHENLSFDLMDEIMYVMAKADWHIFQVLTKRVARLLEYANSSQERWQLMGRLKHVHWGASIGTQRHADLRIPLMLQWPVSMRWLSMEPLLEAVNLGKWIPHDFSMDAKTGVCEDCSRPASDALHIPRWKVLDLPAHPPQLHWIVQGGESGPREKIRPTPHEYFRFIRDQADRANIPLWMKQLSQLDRPSGFADIENFPADLQIQQPARETVAWLPDEIPETGILEGVDDAAA